MRRLKLPVVSATLTLAASLLAPGLAHAVVVDMNAPGPVAAYNPYDQTGYFGVAIAPSERGTSALASANIATVSSNAPCTDPVLAPEFTLPSSGLCYHGGPVVHSNETFAMVWDPRPHTDYASQYVEQYLKDVATTSASSDPSVRDATPYADTTQYTDATGRGGNQSLYGGGYDEQAAYPTNGCNVTGIHHYSLTGSTYTDVPNDVCLTDAQLTTQLRAMVIRNGIVGRVQAGYTPLLVMLTPPGVETCLDATAHLCSANADGSVPAHFCSYHAQITVQGVVFNYLVQPWTPQSSCDEPDAPKFPDPGQPVDSVALTNDMGSRLVSPLSQAHIATLVNPSLSGWFALDGSEINDNGGCAPIDQKLDVTPFVTTSGAPTGTTIGTSYLIQREFNNGGVIVNDPFALPCTSNVGLQPTFVVPSGVSRGDVVQFDGSKTKSTLLVPNVHYVWTFGDGTWTVGPSVVHSYQTAGTYPVTLTVVDRGNNSAAVQQTISVAGPTAPGKPGPTTKPGLSLRLQLLPQGLRSVLRSGLSMRVSSNARADGVITLSISRAAARRAHIRVGRGSSVLIGRGTVSKLIKSGTVTLHLKLSRSMAAKLGGLRHLQITVRVAVVSASGQHKSVVAAAGF